MRERDEDEAHSVGDAVATGLVPAAEPAPMPRSALHTVYLGLGSNLGDRAAALRAALSALASSVRITQVSSVYETAPMHLTDQPDFLNIACRGETALDPLPLLRTVKRIEAALGRTPGPRYGPRVVDIDLLLYDDLTLRTPELTLPHARMAERAFVLVPLAEIAPRVHHPVLGREIAALAAVVATADVRRLGPLIDSEHFPCYSGDTTV